MSTIDLKLKSYDELIFEITTLNTNNYLLQQKVEQLEKENEELKYLVDDSNIIKAFIAEHNKVEQLENIRKEAIKYVQEKADYPISYYHCLNDLLNILNKGENKE